MAKDPGKSPVNPAGRVELLKEKERELAEVVDEHDDLVREQYHMERFVTMITGFDPAIVKHEKGQDYERYARNFDLYLKHGELLGPGRLSRRRVPAALPTQLAPARAIKAATFAKSIKAMTEEDVEDTMVVNRKQLVNEPKTKPSMVIETIPVKQLDTLSKRLHQRRKNGATQIKPQDDVKDDRLVAPILSSARARGEKRKQEVSSSASSSKKKRTKAYTVSRSPSPLIVSSSAFRLTCFEQAVEPNARFGGSFRNYLSSYVMLDEKDVDENSLRRQINVTAQVRERIRLFRKHGRMLGQLEEEPDSGEEGGDAQPGHGQRADRNKKMTVSAMKAAIEPKRVPDHEDHLIAHAVQVRNAMLSEWKTHIANARKIARAIQIYWERINNKDDRLEKLEERKRKLLMRELTKAIRAKWQLAVNVVRARRQAEEKAEQDRLGKKHLELILERSKNLLEGQQTFDLYNIPSDDDETQTQMSDSESTAASKDEDDEETDNNDETDHEEAEEEEESERTEDGAEGADEPEVRRMTDREADSRDVSMELLIQEDSFEIAMDQVGSPHGRSSPLVAEVDSASTGTRDTKQENTEGQSAGDIARKDEGGEDREESEKLNLPTSERTARRQARLPRRRVLRDSAGDTNPPLRYGHDPDDNDFEFADEKHFSDEDIGLDMEMEEDETAMDSDDEEDEGLLADADLPLDQLMAKYGYAANPDASASMTERTTLESGAGSEVEVEMDKSDTSEEESETETASDVSQLETQAEDTARTPFLIRADLRPYQKAGLQWLAQLYQDRRNAILADEMGLGKTLQTISLLAHLACDHGNWGPHLIVVPTSVILNWEMEFKKFLPGFKVLTYYGTQQERKELRKGWLAPHAFEVLITSYQIVLADEFVFKRRQWQYLILDEAHNIKNFRSQRWQTLLGFRSERRLLLTGTPLQNNLMELWSLLYFLMPQGLTNDEETGGFANHKEFNEWFSNPMEKAIELGGALSDEAKATVNRLHLILRPFILRRLKAEVETQLPGKFEHVIYCHLSKRQRYLYDEFMSRTSTKESLISGGYLGVANCLMQLRKVCNHPDLFEVRAIRTSFSMTRSIAGAQEPAYARFQRLLPICERAAWLRPKLQITGYQPISFLASEGILRLDATGLLPRPGVEPEYSAPPHDVRTIAGWKSYRAHQEAIMSTGRWERIRNVNKTRCQGRSLVYSETIALAKSLGKSLLISDESLLGSAIQSYADRLRSVQPVIDRFASITPVAVANDMPELSLPRTIQDQEGIFDDAFDTLHPVAVKLQIAFPDRSLLQHDCGKLQALHGLLKSLKAGGHRVLIFTQMTRMLDILEIFLSHNGHRYSRLDGSTKVEDRLLVTERFNASPKIFALIASTRSGGVGINLTGADTVIFYDNEFNPAMDKQAMDRAHRIGQTREVHIYRLVTSHTVEENMLKKANQKRRLDDLIMQEGDFTTDYFAKTDLRDMLGDDVLSGIETRDRTSQSETPVPNDSSVDNKRMQEALAAAEDDEDAEAARKAFADAELDAPDFGPEEGQMQQTKVEGDRLPIEEDPDEIAQQSVGGEPNDIGSASEDEDDEGGALDEYLLNYVDYEWNDFFSQWKTKRT